jgi:glycogen debranching enzyme
VSEQGADGAIRPNQIFAVSLPHTMLSAERAKKVVEVVERELWTPYGMRTLSPRDSRYARRYEGDARARDAAYHQGTAWPWLTGPFITAYVKVNKASSEARDKATEWLDLFQEEFSHGGLGQVAEIYDAEPPQLPRGCFAQAWSVAELLRAAVQDVFSAPKAKPATRSRVPRAA